MAATLNFFDGRGKRPDNSTWKGFHGIYILLVPQRPDRDENPLQTCPDYVRTTHSSPISGLRNRMTEQLHRRIVESLQDQFAGSEHVAASQLSNAPMPEGIRHFLVRSLERRIHLETRGALESMNDWVDGEHDAVDEIAGTLMHEMGKRPSLPRGLANSRGWA